MKGTTLTYIAQAIFERFPPGRRRKGIKYYTLQAIPRTRYSTFEDHMNRQELADELLLRVVTLEKYSGEI